jgi:hypothetical protein
MTKKKIAIVAVCAVVFASLIFLIAKFALQDKSEAYIVLCAGPTVEIALDAEGNVISVKGNDNEAKDIIADVDFSEMTDAQAVEKIVMLIYDALEVGSKNSISILGIGYFSETLKKSEDEVLALFPSKHKNTFFVITKTGKLDERDVFSIETFFEEKETSAPH